MGSQISGKRLIFSRQRVLTFRSSVAEDADLANFIRSSGALGEYCPLLLGAVMADGYPLSGFSVITEVYLLVKRLTSISLAILRPERRRM